MSRPPQHPGVADQVTLSQLPLNGPYVDITRKDGQQTIRRPESCRTQFKSGKQHV